MPSDLNRRNTADGFGLPVPLAWKKRKTAGVGRQRRGFVLGGRTSDARFSVSAASQGCLRGQGSVEYLFVVVFLVGFVVAVLVPSLQTAEVSYAIAGARTGAVGFEANHSDVRLTVLNYSVEGDTVRLNATVYNRSSDARIVPPQGLKDAMLSGVHALAPGYGVDGVCANTSNYAYCFVS